MRSSTSGAGRPTTGWAPALAEATLGRISGFDVVPSNGIEPHEAFAYHRSAFIASTRAPGKPDGATFGEAVSSNGVAMRLIKDYDYANTTDRCLVNTWLGTAVVYDPVDPTNKDSERILKRAVKITTESDESSSSASASSSSSSSSS